MEIITHVIDDTIIDHKDEDVSERLERQRDECEQVRCKMIGERGCILQSILPDKTKLYLAEPCSAAVAKLPHRQTQEIAA